MKQLEEIKIIGNEILNKTIEKFTKKINISINKEEIKSRINYVKFIQSQLNEITNSIETDTMPDFQKGCLYFGNKTLYCSSDFSQYSNEQKFEIILNQIIHYTGCLYIINNSEVRLSYIMAAINTCYGENINNLEGKNIYNNHKDDFKHIVLDIKKSYLNFVINNKNIMPFINSNIYTDVNKYLTYRIIIGNSINIKNMAIIINDNKIEQILDNIEDNTYYFHMVS